MLWILASLFFFWCAFREIRGSIIAPAGYDFPRPASKPYLAIVLALASAFAWPPVHTWYFQGFLSVRATKLADNHRAKVHCNTLFDTMLDPEMLASGHANPKTGKIAIQQPWCGTLMAYLRHPDRAFPFPRQSFRKSGRRKRRHQARSRSLSESVICHRDRCESFSGFKQPPSSVRSAEVV